MTADIFERILDRTTIKSLEQMAFSAEFSIDGRFQDKTNQTLNFFLNNHSGYRAWTVPLRIHSATTSTRGYAHDEKPYILGFEDLDLLRDKTMTTLKEIGLTKGLYLFCDEIDTEELKEFVQYSTKHQMSIKPHIIHEKFLHAHFSKLLTEVKGISAIPPYTLFNQL